MTGPVRMALAFLSLAIYFFVLGLWQRGKSPRVISGSVDFALLALGLGAFMILGPAGELLVNRLFPRPNIWAWLALTALMGLFGLIGLTKVKTRIVVYHVTAAAMETAVFETMTAIVPPITRTVLGFENEERRCGVSLQISALSGTGVLEALGEHPERLIEAILPVLRRELRHAESPRTLMMTAMFGVSAATFLIAVVIRFGGFMAWRS